MADPSPPTLIVSPQTTNLTISWTQPPDEVVDNYTVSLGYQGECTDFSPPTLTRNLSGGVREFTFGLTSPLAEFSDYLFTIMAINGVGSSPLTSMTVTTLPSGLQ